jgi:hypothetical protein
MLNTRIDSLISKIKDRLLDNIEGRIIAEEILYPFYKRLLR